MNECSELIDNVMNGMFVLKQYVRYVMTKEHECQYKLMDVGLIFWLLLYNSQDEEDNFYVENILTSTAEDQDH